MEVITANINDTSLDTVIIVSNCSNCNLEFQVINNEVEFCCNECRIEFEDMDLNPYQLLENEEDNIYDVSYDDYVPTKYSKYIDDSEFVTNKIEYLEKIMNKKEPSDEVENLLGLELIERKMEGLGC